MRIDWFEREAIGLLHQFTTRGLPPDLCRPAKRVRLEWIARTRAEYRVAPYTNERLSSHAEALGKLFAIW